MDDDELAGLVECALRKVQISPQKGGGSVSISIDGNISSNHYIIDDGIRLANPDGPVLTVAIKALAAENAALKAQLREQVPYTKEEIEMFQSAMDSGVWGVDDMLHGTRDEKVVRAQAAIRALKDKP